MLAYTWYPPRRVPAVAIQSSRMNRPLRPKITSLSRFFRVDIYFDKEYRSIVAGSPAAAAETLDLAGQED